MHTRHKPLALVGTPSTRLMLDCTGVLYDNGRTIDTRYNCYLQANRLTVIAATQNTGTVSFMSGLCQ